MTDIKFGTDGWRGIIAEDFTFYNIRRVAQAIADYIGSNKRIAIGYDTRFMSREFARLVSNILSGNNIKTIISNNPTPTPMLSYFVKHKKMDGGVMITASHNPCIYNGLKFKETHGCSSLSATTNRIEELLDKSAPKIKEDDSKPEDISFPYLASLNKYLIPELMENKRFSIIIDSMYGAGGYYLENILKGYGHKVITINGNPNPLFPGINPEPIEKHLRELSKKVRENKADIGIATDGDADRVGIVDDRGNVLTPHYVLSLLLIHLKTSRGWNGKVVKTISSTSLLNKIADRYGLEIKETPVGFKHIAELMLKEDVLIGGEESGGNGFKNHMPERDGLLSGLLLVEMMGARKKKTSELVKDMEREFGVFKYNRIDLHVEKRPVIGSPKNIIGLKVIEIKDYDGHKFILENGSWLLIRASGTEPILRIYAEASTKKDVIKLVDWAKRLII